MLKLFNPAIIIPLLLLFSVGCGGNGQNFAFYVQDELLLNLTEQATYLPKRFTRMPAPIVFPESKAIWFSYRPDKPDYKTAYAISLSQKSLGWNEIDLKNTILNPDIGYLVDKYRDLPAGKYLLRIAHHNEILNTLEFEVINDREQDEDYIDYEAPIDVVMDPNSDDISVLSRE